MASARDFGDGERNYYSYAHTAALASPTTEGTLACLIRPKTGSDAFGIPAYKERDASSDRAAYGLVTDNQNWGGFFGEVHNGTTLEGNTPTTAQTLNTWYQLLITWKSGGNLPQFLADDPAQDLISETNGSATGTPAAVTFPPVAALESLISRGIDVLGMLCDT